MESCLAKNANNYFPPKSVSTEYFCITLFEIPRTFLFVRIFQFLFSSAGFFQLSPCLSPASLEMSWKKIFNLPPTFQPLFHFNQLIGAINHLLHELNLVR